MTTGPLSGRLRTKPSFSSFGPAFISAPVSRAAVRIPLRVTTLALSRTKCGGSSSLIVDLKRNGSKIAVRRWTSADRRHTALSHD